jgi:protein TonB
MIEEPPAQAVEDTHPERREPPTTALETPPPTTALERPPPATALETPGPAETSIAIPAVPPTDDRPSASARAVAPAGGPGPPTAGSAPESPIAPSGPRIAAIPQAGSEFTRTAKPRGGYQVVPSYPAAARRLGIEGTTLLRVFVLDDGRVGEVQIQNSAGHPALDRAAAEAVRRWRFDPARKGADAVSVWVLLPVEFHLTR